jgi:hypothetical protein
LDPVAGSRGKPLSGLLQRALAAHPLRGVPEPRDGHFRRQQGGNVAASAAEDDCGAVFATEGYEASVSSLFQISLDSDDVFSDGADLQLPTISGSVDAGFVAKLNVTI